MPSFLVGETEIVYDIRRSDRAKSVRITVTPERVEIIVPQATTESEVADLLHRRRGWLLDQTRQMEARLAAVPRVGRFMSGAKIPYRGRLMRLTVTPTDAPLVEVQYRNGFHVGYPQRFAESSRDDLIESALRLWLRKRLREDAAEFVARHGVTNGLKPKRLQIKEQKHLWGSCGQDRVINLNWNLIFSPKTVLEYAVVHELCHLKQRNHDEEFWALVGSILPDWQLRKKWLDQNEHLLSLSRINVE